MIVLEEQSEDHAAIYVKENISPVSSNFNK
jgi:hypothetical protein